MTLERTRTPDCSKAPMAHASHAHAPDYMVMEQWAPS
jgi:hypothetical protein